MGQDFEAKSNEGIMRQAEVVALHALTDQLGMLNNNLNSVSTDVKDLSRDLRDVRERLIQVEATNFSELLKREVVAFTNALSSVGGNMRRIEDKCDGNYKDLLDRHEKLNNAYSNLTGRLLPLATVGLLILSAVIAVIIKAIH